MFGLRRILRRSYAAIQRRWATDLFFPADGVSEGVFLRAPAPGYVKGETLLNVLPIVQSCEVEEGRVTLSCVEVYEDGCLVRYILVGSAFHPSRLARSRDLKKPNQRSSLEYVERYVAQEAGLWGRDPDVRIRDDVGTEYACSPWGSSGDYRVTRSVVGVTPSIPGSARRLESSFYKRTWFWDGEHVSSKREEEPFCTFEVDI